MKILKTLLFLSVVLQLGACAHYEDRKVASEGDTPNAKPMYRDHIQQRY